MPGGFAKQARVERIEHFSLQKHSIVIGGGFQQTPAGEKCARAHLHIHMHAAIGERLQKRQQAQAAGGLFQIVRDGQNVRHDGILAGEAAGRQSSRSARDLQESPRCDISRAVEERAVFRRRENNPLIRVLQGITVCYARIYHGLTVARSPHLPKKGAAILVCNHTSSLDPILLQAICPRLVRWMMAKEYFQVKPLRFFFRAVGVILVDRGGRDMAATRAALRALDDGYVLGVFPEGKIETSSDLLPFMSGIGMMALRSGAPVYAAYLDGTQRGKDMVEVYVHRVRATVAFGPQVDLSGLNNDKEGIQTATARIQEAVEALKNTYCPPPATADTSS